MSQITENLQLNKTAYTGFKSLFMSSTRVVYGVAGVKRGRGRGNLGAQGRKVSRPNSLHLPFRTPAAQATLACSRLRNGGESEKSFKNLLVYYVPTMLSESLAQAKATRVVASPTSTSALITLISVWLVRTRCIRCAY